MVFRYAFEAGGDKDNFEILSTNQEVPAYRYDVSFMFCDKRMC